MEDNKVVLSLEEYNKLFLRSRVTEERLNAVYNTIYQHVLSKGIYFSEIEGYSKAKCERYLAEKYYDSPIYSHVIREASSSSIGLISYEDLMNFAREAVRGALNEQLIRLVMAEKEKLEENSNEQKETDENPF